MSTSTTKKDAKAKAAKKAEPKLKKIKTGIKGGRAADPCNNAPMS